MEVRKFPDGETYIRIPVDVRGKGIIYVNSLQPHPNESLVETLLTLDAVRSQGAQEVIAVIPYMSYARQDEMFSSGEAVSVWTVGSLFRALKLDHVLTVDMHLHRIKEPERVFGSAFTNITGVHEISRFVRTNLTYRDRVVVGPDEESEQWAGVLSGELGVPYVVLEKRRISGTEVRIYEKEVDVKGRDVIIVDDIISTGGTIIEAVKLLRQRGANRIAVTAVHPLLVGDAYHRLRELDLEVMAGTDTVLSPISVISIAPAIAGKLKELIQHN